MTTLSSAEAALLHGVRRAVLATIRPDGTPRLVPIAFVATTGDDGSLVLWSSLDEKPKADGDPRELARVRDILARPRVEVVVDRWSETWAELAWLRLRGAARLVEPGAVPDGVVDALRQRYPQYGEHDLAGRPMLAIGIDAASSWFASDVVNPGS
jgi:PPOX class probable F420-dependent enzyme